MLQDEQAGNDAIKVAREVYYPGENSHRDFVIYKRSDLNFAIKKREQQVVQKITGTNDDSDDDWFDDDDFDYELFRDDQWSNG